MTALSFIPARNYTRGRRKQVRLLVVHDMEMLDSPTTAENCARYFQNETPSSQSGSSAHFCCDQDSVVQCVSIKDTAWAAPNANADGVHFEIGGYARDPRQGWLTENNKHALFWAGCQLALVYGLLRYFGVNIELRRLTAAEVAAGKAGICGHNDVTAAFHTVGGHTDPGDNFPWDVFLDGVKWWVAQFDAHGWPTPNYR